MGKQFARIEPEHRAFIERQKIFFRRECSPEGTGKRLAEGAVVIPRPRRE